MNGKPKALSLAIVAAMAAFAVVATGATGQTGGHFVGAEANINLGAIETPGAWHNMHFNREGQEASQRIGCKIGHHVARMTTATTTEVTFTPFWDECYTTGNPETELEVRVRSCKFTFTIGKVPTGHNTGHLKCLSPDTITIYHPNCLISIPSQSFSGVSYTTVVSSPAHQVTMTSTVTKITTHYEAGICIFLGTTNSSEMIGSVVVSATNGFGQSRSIAATG